MKTALFLGLSLLVSASNAFAGKMSLDCVGYRVSKDTNQNIQEVKISYNDGVTLYGGTAMPITEGSFQELPADFTAQASDGKGDYRITATSLIRIGSFDGHVSIGRDHNVVLSKVAITVSRNGQSQKFIGTCTEEIVTSCGGACEDESPVRDEI